MTSTDIPTKKIPRNNLGLNPQTRQKIKERRKILNILRKNKNNAGLKNKVKELNKTIKKGKREEQQKTWDYITKTIINKKNPKKSWKTLKKLLNENEIKTT